MICTLVIIVKSWIFLSPFYRVTHQVITKKHYWSCVGEMMSKFNSEAWFLVGEECFLNGPQLLWNSFWACTSNNIISQVEYYFFLLAGLVSIIANTFPQNFSSFSRKWDFSSEDGQLNYPWTAGPSPQFLLTD